MKVRSSYRVEWNFPGGSVRRDETPEAAARRELAEEIGLQGVPAEFTPDELERWSKVTETPTGLLRPLKPVMQLSETPPRCARPSVPLGYHKPELPLRGSA
jgi:8-oxo-dGTP pyrophosphatase MutT (NUDIX family)